MTGAARYPVRLYTRPQTMAMMAAPKLESRRSREYSRDALARTGIAMASVSADVGPAPALMTIWQTITATTGSGALRPRANTAAGMQASCSARLGPVKMSPTWPQAGSANE